MTPHQIRELRKRDVAIGIILDEASLAIRAHAKFTHGGPFHKDKEALFALADVLEGVAGEERYDR